MFSNIKNLLVVALVTVALVAGAITSAASTASAQQAPTQRDVAVRDQLVRAQESLLNAYRCRFNIDTHAVPGGCLDGQPPSDSSNPVRAAHQPDHHLLGR